MVSSLPRHFQFAVLARALLLAGLIVILLRLMSATQFYATELVVLLVGLLVVADLLRVVAHAERSTQRFLESLSAGALEAPASGQSSSGQLLQAFERARQHLQEERRTQRQSADYLQTLLDTVPAALMVVATDGAVRMVNRAAHRLLGEPAPRLEQLATLGPGAAHLLRVLMPGAQQIVRLPDGRQLLASASQFTVPEGAAQRLLCLQRLAGDLDAVEHKAWDDMARVLAHEIMNSLTPIASLSESLDALLRAGGRNDEVAAALEAIRRRSLGLMRFVERYRKVAELPEPVLQPLSLKSALQGVERLLAPALEQGHVGYASTVLPPDLIVQGDADLLEQALINLLRNAAEAVRGQPGARIEVVCGLETGLCFIDVADNGPGLSAAAREQIFVPFFTTKAGGSGIGLSLARRIALYHGGQVSVRSTPQGSVFRLSLPA
ncbi:MAG TPA: ATP-binding protein [Steroidobacteraceae bacterium]|jgi:two-component system nitrogen regulation sensor histidine kinase NtrY|nr:ATP-binding protein [Steroidobacteraceae bacterium]